MEAAPFEVSLRWEDSHPFVRVRGELDFATAPILRDTLRKLLSEGAEEVTLDFREVTFLDSEGLKVLLQAYRQLHARGGSIKVWGCSRFVARTFEILGVDRRFDITTA